MDGFRAWTLEWQETKTTVSFLPPVCAHPNMAHLVSVTTTQQSPIWTDHSLESKQLKRPMLCLIWNHIKIYKMYYKRSFMCHLSCRIETSLRNYNSQCAMSNCGYKINLFNHCHLSPNHLPHHLSLSQYLWCPLQCILYNFFLVFTQDLLSCVRQVSCNLPFFPLFINVVVTSVKCHTWGDILNGTGIILSS